jgi:hypothetical protein
MLDSPNHAVHMVVVVGFNYKHSGYEKHVDTLAFAE